MKYKLERRTWETVAIGDFDGPQEAIDQAIEHLGVDPEDLRVSVVDKEDEQEIMDAMMTCPTCNRKMTVRNGNAVCPCGYTASMEDRFDDLFE